MLRYVCSFTVKVISHPDNSTSFEVIESQLENPLIDADHHDLVAMKQIPVPGGHHHKTQHKRNQTDDRNREYFILFHFPSFTFVLLSVRSVKNVICSSIRFDRYIDWKLEDRGIFVRFRFVREVKDEYSILRIETNLTNNFDQYFYISIF